jgi:RNA polymerase sigma factor (sigma-70 family)
MTNTTSIEPMIAEHATPLLNNNAVAHSRADLAGFEEVAMPLFNSLYNFARWLSHDQNDAEDLVQETYLKALRSFGSFQPGTNFRAWIFRILRNTFPNSCSKLERRMTVEMDSEEDTPALSAISATPEALLTERSS